MHWHFTRQLLSVSPAALWAAVWRLQCPLARCAHPPRFRLEAPHQWHTRGALWSCRTQRLCVCGRAHGTVALSKRARHDSRLPSAASYAPQVAVSRPVCAAEPGHLEAGGLKRGGEALSTFGAAAPAKAPRLDADSGDAATLSNGHDTGDTSAPLDGAQCRSLCQRGGGRVFTGLAPLRSWHERTAAQRHAWH